MAETNQTLPESEKVWALIRQSGQTPEVRQRLLDANKFADGQSLRDYIKSISDLSPWANHIIDTTNDVKEVIDSVLVVLSDARVRSGESALKIFLRHLLD